MNIIVCVKQVQDPEIPPSKFKIDPETKQVIPPAGVPPVISVYDERALEAACRLKDKYKAKIVAITIGTDKASEVIRHAISMGADDGYLLCDPAFESKDSFKTAYILSKAIEKIGAFDLVLCGRQAADWGAGQVGSILGEMLTVPVVSFACDIDVVDTGLRVKRVVSDGYEILEVPMPCLITVSSEVGLPRLPSGMRIMLARKKPIPVWKATDINIEHSLLEKGHEHTEIIGLVVPERKSECEIIKGTPKEAAYEIAERLVSML
ncbi:MAG: electron transfer flavoprotein subunit beta/FixA family protein [Syntrophorhabdaceae bacterium]|nr:electron transfer flavoprotein subunit beta/FixA family protein [Syntrophorhabdaceae bacterium]